MKLIGSQTSPFVRAVRALLIELEQPFELVETFGFGKTTPEQHKEIDSNNPLLRVPVLIIDDTSVFETRVICMHLLRTYPVPAGFRHRESLSLEEENTISVILGALDAAILRFMMLKSDPALKNDTGYLRRFAQRLDSAFEWLERQVTDDAASFGTSFGLSELLVVCALDWLTARNAYDCSRFEKLGQLRAAMSARPSLEQTGFPMLSSS